MHHSRTNYFKHYFRFSNMNPPYSRRGRYNNNNSFRGNYDNNFRNNRNYNNRPRNNSYNTPWNNRGQYNNNYFPSNNRYEMEYEEMPQRRYYNNNTNYQRMNRPKPQDNMRMNSDWNNSRGRRNDWGDNMSDNSPFQQHIKNKKYRRGLRMKPSQPINKWPTDEEEESDENINMSRPSSDEEANEIPQNTQLEISNLHKCISISCHSMSRIRIYRCFLCQCVFSKQEEALKHARTSSHKQRLAKLNNTGITIAKDDDRTAPSRYANFTSPKTAIKRRTNRMTEEDLDFTHC